MSTGGHAPDFPQPGPPELPFEASTSLDWSGLSAKTFTVSTVGRDVVLHGPCPRCGHIMEMAHYDSQYVVKTIAPPMPSPRTGEGSREEQTSSADPDTAQTVYLLCTCAVSHPGRPDDDIGCGAYWNLVLAES